MLTFVEITGDEEQETGNGEIDGSKNPEGRVFFAGGPKGSAHRVDVDETVRSPSVRNGMGEEHPRLGHQLFRPGDTGHEKEDEGG